jgi:hypothetical protein
MMHNSGVVGLPGRKAETALKETLGLTDELLLICRRRQFSEQAAFSIVLPRHFDLTHADRAIFHYWPEKAAAPSLLATFFAESQVTPNEAVAFDFPAKTSALMAKMTKRKPSFLSRMTRSASKRWLDLVAYRIRFRRWLTRTI